MLALFNALRDLGVEADLDVMADYVAIKHLRNGIIHAGWNSDQQQYIESRGFPTTLEQLNEEHWKRIQKTAVQILNYFTNATIEDHSEFLLSGGKNQQLSDEVEKLYDACDLSVTYAQTHDFARLLVRKQDIPQVFFRNLEAIYEHVSSRPLSIAQEKPVDVSELGVIAIESWEEWHRCLATGADDFRTDVQSAESVFQKLRERNQYSQMPLGIRLSELLNDWRERVADWQVHGVNERRIAVFQRAMGRLEEANEAGVQLDMQLWDRAAPEAPARDIVAFCLDTDDTDASKIHRALSIGYHVYAHLRGILLPTLFLDRLPTVDAAHALDYAVCGEAALELWQLQDSWRAYVESVGSSICEPAHEKRQRFVSVLKTLRE